MNVKICGVCSSGDAVLAESAGASHVGVILAGHGRRARTLAEASAIFDRVEGAARVGVFVDQPTDAIEMAFTRLRLDVIQLHGAEEPAVLARLKDRTGARIWKAVPIRRAGDLERAVAAYERVADGLLLDGERGGAGLVFDWHLAAHARAVVPARMTLIVAGGLNPDNVRLVGDLLKPDIADVASGVESAPGVKSRALIERFVTSARA